MSLHDPVRNRPGLLAHAMHIVPLFPWFASLGAFLRAQGRSNGRSVVVSDPGVSAGSHFLVSQSGKQILAEGAMDATIARNTALGVTEPRMKGRVGDASHQCWAAKSDQWHGLDASRSNGFGQ